MKLQSNALQGTTAQANEVWNSITCRTKPERKEAIVVSKTGVHSVTGCRDEL